MGGSYSPAPPESIGTILQQYTNNLPSLLGVLGQGIPTVQQGATAAAQQSTPALNALNLSQLQQFGLPEAQIGQQIQNSNALAGAQTNLNQITGPGGQAAQAAQNLATNVSPAYAAAQKGAAEGVNAINLNGLSPGEEASVERSLNQSNAGTGNLGLLNPTNTISNALNFGGAFNSKIPLLNQATSTANSVAGSGVVNPVNIALGQPNTSTQSNMGTGQFQTGNSSSGNTGASGSTGFAGGLLSGLTSLNNANVSGNVAQNTSPTSTMGEFGPSSLSGICCFIFLEAYYGNIPPQVRRARDKAYKINPYISRGYKKMAKWLVPLMRRSYIIRSVVWFIMIKPITQYVSQMRIHYNKKKIANFWIKFWSFYGRV
jgi:hypothetical protein